jgi:hypothetical protein
LNIKIRKQKKNLKIVSVHAENTDKISKMIKKEKIFRVRVPLKVGARLLLIDAFS